MRQNTGRREQELTMARRLGYENLTCRHARGERAVGPRMKHGHWWGQAMGLDGRATHETRSLVGTGNGTEFASGHSGHPVPP